MSIMNFEEKRKEKRKEKLLKKMQEWEELFKKLDEKFTFKDGKEYFQIMKHKADEQCDRNIELMGGNPTLYKEIVEEQYNIYKQDLQDLQDLQDYNAIKSIDESR